MSRGYAYEHGLLDALRGTFIARDVRVERTNDGAHPPRTHSETTVVQKGGGMKLRSMRLLAATAVSAFSLLLGVPTLGSGDNAAVASASAIPDCSGKAFWGGWVGKNGATGTSIFDVAFINDGRTTCRLAGYPKIQGYRNGREYALVVGHIKGTLFGLSPTTVAPRMSGEMVLTTGALCNALNIGSQSKIKKVIAENSYTVSVTFPNSNDKVYVYGLTLDVACGLNITQLGWK